MARPKVPYTPPEARDADTDDRDLARTLEAELTRQATRAQPAGRPAPAVWGAPKPQFEPAVSSPPAPASASPFASPEGIGYPEGAPEATGMLRWMGDVLPAVELYALGRWMLLLGLFNIVLSGFILMYWGIPQWESRSMRLLTGRALMEAFEAGAANPSASGGARSRATKANDARYRIDPNATVTGASPVLRPARSAAAETGIAGANRAGINGAGGNATGGATRGGANAVPAVPEPVLIATTPDVDPPPAPNLDLSRASSENALSTVETAARADTRNPGIAVAGEAGVSMPERLPESYVRPSIATLPGSEPVTGEVKLAAVVRADGSVQDLAVLSTTRAGAGLEQAALAAVRQWRYKPAMRGGAPVDARLTITVTFR